jgi:hypothetical protein
MDSELSVCKELLVTRVKVTETLVHTFVHVNILSFGVKIFSCAKIIIIIIKLV